MKTDRPHRLEALPARLVRRCTLRNTGGGATCGQGATEERDSPRAATIRTSNGDVEIGRAGRVAKRDSGGPVARRLSHAGRRSYARRAEPAEAAGIPQ